MAEAAVQERESTGAETNGESTALTTAGERAVAAKTGQIGWGAAPRNLDEAWRMANILAKSALVPKAFQNKPEDTLVAMQYGAEVGLPPLASLQSIGVINGKPGLYGDGFLGVIQGKPAYAKHVEYYELADGARVNHLRVVDYSNDDTRAVSIFWRHGNPEPFEGSFSIGDAKRAKLWTKEGPWTQYPARQLMWRARGFAGRNGFAAELRGIKTTEELIDTPDDAIDVSVETIATAPPAEPVRRSEQAAAQAATPPVSDAASEPTSDRDGTAAKPAGSSKTTRAAASPAKPSGPGQVTKNVMVMETSFVGGDASHHEIRGVIYENGKSGLGFTWITRDEQLAKLAESCEGSQKLFTVTWHEEKVAEDKKAKALKVITGLTAAD